MSSNTHIVLPSGEVLRLTPADIGVSPPLSLYPGPWGFAAVIAFVFRGAGRYLIDDIDNAGVERGNEQEPRYRVLRKEVLSKKGWTNCRPLTAVCPDGFASPNTARSRYLSLEDHIPLARVARWAGTNVERFVRSTSSQYGLWTMVGPDRAITGTSMSATQDAIRAIIQRHEEAVSATVADVGKRPAALARLRSLMPDPAGHPSLLSYFTACLERVLRTAGSAASAGSLARDHMDPDGGRLFRYFAGQDPAVISAYNDAAGLQGSRKLGPDHWVPYYTVSLADGSRRPITARSRRGADDVIAPKILVLEDAPCLALPRETAADRSIVAREYLYRHLETGSSQVFFESNWLETLQRSEVVVNVAPLLRPLMGGRPRAALGELLCELVRCQADLNDHPLRHSDAYTDAETENIWRLWAASETINDLRFEHYPLLSYAIAGQEWLEGLRLVSYGSYTSTASFAAER